jgi:hypothetical protein
MSGPGFAFQTSACWGKIIFAEQGNLPRELVEAGLPPEKPNPFTFAYDLPEDGEVTIQIFNEDKLIVRTLMAEASRLGGPQAEKWDALDELGAPLPPGSYTWEGLYHQPITLKYIMSVHNSGQPGHKTDDDGRGGWGGDHGVPVGAVAVREQMILVWGHAETGWGIIGTDLEGRKKWGSSEFASHVATDGQRLFAAGCHSAPVDAVKVLSVTGCKPLAFGGGAATVVLPREEGTEPERISGLACHSGRLYVSCAAKNLVAVFDATSGGLLRSVNVDGPGQMAGAADGAVLVSSRSGKVLRLAGDEVSVFSDRHLDAPAGIAVDADGRVYVANRGASLRNVSVFDAGGKYLRSIGKPGGRPLRGRYDPSGMLAPNGIAIDAQGRLWVPESIDSPKRISVWDTSSGKLVAEYFGGGHYSTKIYMDPQHSDEAYCHNVLWRIDLDKRTWTPYSTIWRASNPNQPDGSWRHLGNPRVFTAKNGRQYGWAYEHGRGSYLLIREGDIFKPLLGFISCVNYAPAVYPPYPLFAGDPNKWDGTFAWVDANDDQTFQLDEITKIGPQHYRNFAWVDAELNIWHGHGDVYRPVKIRPDGMPVYDFAAPKKLPFRGANSYWPLMADPDGSVYVARIDRQEQTFSRRRLDGSVDWMYQNVVGWHQALNLIQKPGRLIGATHTLGAAGAFTGVASYFGTYHVLTRDGLYVAMLCEDGREAGRMGHDIAAAETFNGQIVQPEGVRTADGKPRFFLLYGDQDGRISEILGLDTVKRLPGGTLTITEGDAAQAAEALAAYEAATAKAQRLTIVRGLPALETATPIEKRIDFERSLAVRAAYDNDKLYLRYDVISPVPLVNAEPRDQLIFKGGNLLDLQLATDPKAGPERTAPAPGDLRILATMTARKPRVVVFRPKAAGFEGDRIVLTSPTGAEAFDRIERADRIGLEYRPKEGVNGFTALLTVPLDAIGLTLEPGSQVRMDVGYIFGNKTGARATLRTYWTNNSFSANVLNDVPNESRLEPHEWGEAVVE